MRICRALSSPPWFQAPGVQFFRDRGPAARPRLPSRRATVEAVANGSHRRCNDMRQGRVMPMVVGTARGLSYFRGASSRITKRMSATRARGAVKDVSQLHRVSGGRMA
jgi:hypothetical protein